MKRFTKTGAALLGKVPGMPTPKPPPQRKTPTARAAAQAAAQAAGQDFKGLQDWIEVFEAGERTDSKGRTANFTQADLDQMVANVTGAGVPAVLGHPAEADPAYAWGTLKRDGDKLLAKFADINADFEAAVDAGAYRERSVRVYKDPVAGWKVLHVGWLGAVAPALALKPLSYSSAAGQMARPAEPAGDDCADYSSDAQTGWALGDLARLLRGLRDWLIGEKGLDVADKVLPDWTLTSLADTARRIAEAPEPDATVLRAYAAAGAHPHTPGAHTMPAPAGTATITEADLQRARDEATAAATAAATAQFAAQGAELAELRAARQAERIGVQINGWKAAGLVTPAEEPGMAEFMAALEGGQAGEFNFSAADKSAAKKTPAQWFADYVAARPAVKLGPQGAMGEDPKPGVDTEDAQAIAKAAKEFMHAEAQAGRTVSAAQAVQHVTQPAKA